MIKHLTTSKLLSISTHDEGTRFQSNKWSRLDYLLSNDKIEKAQRFKHVSNSDHSPIGINITAKPEVKESFREWRLTKDIDPELLLK